MAITDYHKKIFDFLERYRIKHSEVNLTYALRQRDREDRPKVLFPFHGDKKSRIFVGLYQPYNGNTRYRTIGLNCSYDSEKDELTFFSLLIMFNEVKIEKEREIYTKIINAIGSSEFRSQAEDIFYHVYEGDTLEQKLTTYLEKHKPIIDIVIGEENLKHKFLIPRKKFVKNLEDNFNKWIEDTIEWKKDIDKRVGDVLIKQREKLLEFREQVNNYPKNTILYGPPGTGKTYSTVELAVAIVDGAKSLDRDKNKARFDQLRKGDDRQIEFVTFHQNYSYEDFVVGLRPDTNAGTLTFERTYGIFHQIAERARLNFEQSQTPVKNYVLIIDEINRANISRVFGELITLLEDDKRLGAPNALTVTLPNGEAFSVPPNLYLIGTMNTADKSLALLDIALRRRFEFEGVYPQPDLLDEPARSLLKRLNEAIKKAKNGSADFLVGHAYFMSKRFGPDGRQEPLTADELKAAMEKRVFPLLLEYMGGSADRVKDVLKTASIGCEENPQTYLLEYQPTPTNDPV